MQISAAGIESTWIRSAPFARSAAFCYRSTLFTAVEQHFSDNPSGYSVAFAQLRESGGRDHGSWLVAAVEAMVARSRLAFLHRTGELSGAESNLKTRCDLALQLARIDEEERFEFSLSADP